MKPQIPKSSGTNHFFRFALADLNGRRQARRNHGQPAADKAAVFLMTARGGFSGVWRYVGYIQNGQGGTINAPFTISIDRTSMVMARQT